MDFGDGRVVVKDYEAFGLTRCGTIRFTCGLDIESENTLVDYMCGARFENVVITSAKATVLEEMYDDKEYARDAGEEYEDSDGIDRNMYNTKLYFGEYDILNSNPETLARFHTIVYTPTCVSYDFSTAGKDVYGFSFDTAK